MLTKSNFEVVPSINLALHKSPSGIATSSVLVHQCNVHNWVIIAIEFFIQQKVHQEFHGEIPFYIRSVTKFHVLVQLPTQQFVFIDFSVNIQPADGPRKGKVQIYNNGEWGLVCSDGWDSHDATVVCQEKLFGTNGNAIQVAYDNSETLWLSGVKCIGNESQLSFCPHTGIGIVDNCTSVAGVECSGKMI